MVPLHVQLTRSTLRKVVKRLHFPLEVMLVCVRWYAAYPLSLRNLEEMMAERGVLVDLATVHRWALKILPVLAAVFRRRKLPAGPSWRVDETYVLVGENRGQRKQRKQRKQGSGLALTHPPHSAMILPNGSPTPHRVSRRALPRDLTR